MGTLLESNDYNEDLRRELQKSNPNYMNGLYKRRRDLENSEHGLVVSGVDCVILYLENILYSVLYFLKKRTVFLNPHPTFVCSVLFYLQTNISFCKELTQKQSEINKD